MNKILNVIFFLWMWGCVAFGQIPLTAKDSEAIIVATRYIKLDRKGDYEGIYEMLHSSVKRNFSFDLIKSSLGSTESGSVLEGIFKPRRSFFINSPNVIFFQISQKNEEQKEVLYSVLLNHEDGKWKVLYCHPSRIEEAFSKSLDLTLTGK